MADPHLPPADARSDRWRPPWVSQAAHLLFLVGAAGSIFAAGRVHEANLGVFLVLAGIALLACPPQARVDWSIVGLAAAFLALCSLALLPQSWFPAPEWRQRLAASAFPEIGSVTPAPHETLFWLAVVAVGICVALFGLAHPINTRGLTVVGVSAVLICAIYAGLAIYARQTGWEYPLSYDPGVFGFFPNRNNTGTFLITGCMVSLGILGVWVRGRDWIAVALAAVCLGLGVASLIFFSSSRGGIVFLLAGAVLWVAGLGRAHFSRPLLISFGAIFAASLLMFVASKSAVLDRLVHFGGQIRERVQSAELPLAGPESSAAEAEVPLDGRIAIFKDTLRMIRDYPITGTGLGTFRYTFRFYGRDSLGFAAPIHPESDWLMLASEAGIPALIGLAVGLGWLLRRVWRLRNHPAWPLRWGILSAALAAALHGFVDTPVHRAALGCWILVLGVVGLQTPPNARVGPSRIQHLIFIAGGIGALALGVHLMRAEWFGGRHTAPFAGYFAEPEVIVERFEGNVNEARETARREIRSSPMSDRLYAQLGEMLLGVPGSEAEAESVLATQRLLNPNPPEIPVWHGLLWIDRDPARTLALWLEAIERRARIDAARGEPQGTVSLFRDLIRQAETRPDLQRRLLAAVARGPEFALVWLESAAPDALPPELARLSGEPEFLAQLDEAGRRRFLRVWYERGGKPELFAFIENHPEWNEAAWPVQLRQLVEAGKFEEAVKAVARRHQISLDLPPSISGAADSSAVDEANPGAAFTAYWRRGNVVAARRVLEESRRSDSQDREVWRTSAALAASEGQWPAAWSALDRWLRLSSLDSIR